MSADASHRPGVKAKTQEERDARTKEKNRKAQQRARDRKSRRGLRDAVRDAKLEPPATPEVVRAAQTAPLTAERQIPQKEAELAQATLDARRAAAELRKARLQSDIDGNQEDAHEFREEAERIRGGDDEGLSAALGGASISVPLPAYDGGRPPLVEPMSDVYASADGKKLRTAAFTVPAQQ